MLEEYYADPHIRARIFEFLGGDSPQNVTCAYITADGPSADVCHNPRPPSELPNCLDDGLEIGRSLWDHEALIAHLDIEIVNFDFPAEPWIHPNRCIDLQRPVVAAIQEFLINHGIAPLHLLSGRGHHFVWRIDLRSTACDSLTAIGSVAGASQCGCPGSFPSIGQRHDGPRATAHAGLGMVMEYVAHRVLDVAAGDCELPVMLTAVEAGPNAHGREVVSIDLSEYGDPLHTRGVRVPFSAYLKPQQQRWRIGAIADEIPGLFMIPLHEMEVHQGIQVMRAMDEVQDLARRGSVQIPDQSRGTERLLEEYATSQTSLWHRQFYSAEHDPSDQWPKTYDRLPLQSLPPCARIILEQPNDRLLKPAGIQHLVRILLGFDWHPRHIAGLIRSKYERDYGWGDRWYRYDAATHADFYVRTFAGLIATGRDGLVDLNCRSCQEKQYCPVEVCSDNLLRYRDRVRIRVETTTY
ncbi:hypothetical protein FYK55_14140 [Roseiconus nitratireducens]|uniref:Uncharacterized protein n=1 Tax=Roseiconus nitratireducens TaxID=2605748 RepID=A0A5M6D9P5_9BACT|nr:hypothetical protein [Roseiconus nitratireducens]KAA5542669.1 hypothetical protein FYK55_14140 [Roseiconus nitratireducens]